MLDLKFIRENPDEVVRGLSAKGVILNIKELLSLDIERRALLKEADDLKAKRNTANDEISNLKKAGKSADGVISEMKTISQKIAILDGKVGEAKRRSSNKRCRGKQGRPHLG